MSGRVSPRLQFVPLREEHIAEIIAIADEAYPDPWSETMVRDELRNHLSRFYVAFHEEVLIGYGGFWLVADEAHITTVTVRDTHRSSGYGRQLLEFLLQEALAAGATLAALEVRASNDRAIALYSALGFRQIGRRKAYYGKTNEDALVMMKELD